MSRRHGRADLLRQLNEVNQRIAEHPSASERVRTANQLVEEKKAQNAETDDINTVLEEEGLPRLEELGKITAKGILSWGLFHRRKRKIEHKISRTET